MANLEGYIPKFVRKYAPEQPDLRLLIGERGAEVLREALAKLERAGILELTYDDAHKEVAAIYYPTFYSVEIQRWYTRMNDDRSLPFPTENDLGIAIPTDLLQTVDVSNNLMHWIESDDESLNQILILQFPDGVDPLLTTVRALREQSLPLVLNKIRDYLRTDKNAGFLETKLRSIFPTREMLVHDVIETAQTRPDDALQSIVDPNDFQFHFWTQLSSIVIKEYAKKNEKLEMEHGFCQAAYLLGYYAVFHKGRAQKDHQRDEARKLLRTRVQKPPYVFRIQDLHKLPDDRGLPLEKKVPTAEINEWIEEMLKRPSEHQISELVSFDSPEQNGLIIHSRQYIPLLQRQIKAAAPVLKRELTNRMVAELSEDNREEWIDDELAFENVLRDRVREEFPLLIGLATFNTLFLVLDGQELPSDQKEAAMAMIDTGKKSMRSWTEILDIDQHEMYKDARLQLPVWMIIPIVRGIVRLMRAMFSNDPTGKTAKRHKKHRRKATDIESTPDGVNSDTGNDSTSREAKRKQFHDALETMQKRYLTPDQTPDQRLKQLRKNWNPLIDPVAHENLIEDVNSLCRDTLRKMRSVKSLQAPDQARIKEQAKRIAGNSAFDRIKRRKDFETYLELYMITTLRRM